MSIDRLSQLKALHLYGMAAAWSEWQAESHNQPVIPELWLDRLIEAEQADRQARSLRYQLKVARFPIHRDLRGFVWADKSVGNGFEQRLRWPRLCRGAYQDDTHSPPATSPSGTTGYRRLHGPGA